MTVVEVVRRMILVLVGYSNVQIPQLWRAHLGVDPLPKERGFSLQRFGFLPVCSALLKLLSKSECCLVWTWRPWSVLGCHGGRPEVAGMGLPKLYFEGLQWEQVLREQGQNSHGEWERQPDGSLGRGRWGSLPRSPSWDSSVQPSPLEAGSQHAVLLASCGLAVESCGLTAARSNK